MTIAQDPAADGLLGRDPLALLIGMLLDQHRRQGSTDVRGWRAAARGPGATPGLPGRPVGGGEGSGWLLWKARARSGAHLRAAAYSWRNSASVSAMSAISAGATLSFGAWIAESGSSTPTSTISAAG